MGKEIFVGDEAVQPCQAVTVDGRKLKTGLIYIYIYIHIKSIAKMGGGLFYKTTRDFFLCLNNS